MKKPERGDLGPASEAAARGLTSPRTQAGLVSLARGNEVKVKRPPPNADGAATEIVVEFGYVYVVKI